METAKVTHTDTKTTYLSEIQLPTKKPKAKNIESHRSNVHTLEEEKPTGKLTRSRHEKENADLQLAYANANLADVTARKFEADTELTVANTEFTKAQTAKVKLETEQLASRHRFFLTTVIMALVAVGTLSEQIWQGHQKNVAASLANEKAAIANQRDAIENDNEKTSLFLQALESFKKNNPELTQAYVRIHELEGQLRESYRQRELALQKEAGSQKNNTHNQRSQVETSSVTTGPNSPNVASGQSK
jgi:hypothetical protein